MLRWVTLLALLAALTASGAAASVGEISALVSHRAPFNVECSSAAEWKELTHAAGRPETTSGLAWVNAGRARFAPWVCEAVDAGTKDSRLGAALNAVVHETAHLLGERDESVAACWGLLWSADIAWRFWNVRFFTPMSERIIGSAMSFHRALPPDYHRVCP